MAIAYCEHPITRVEKLEIRRGGFTVVDLRFKPDKLADGDKVVKKTSPKKAK